MNNKSLIILKCLKFRHYRNNLKLKSFKYIDRICVEL